MTDLRRSRCAAHQDLRGRRSNEGRRGGKDFSPLPMLHHASPVSFTPRLDAAPGPVLSLLQSLGGTEKGETCFSCDDAAVSLCREDSTRLVPVAAPRVQHVPAAAGSEVPPPPPAPPPPPPPPPLVVVVQTPPDSRKLRLLEHDNKSHPQRCRWLAKPGLLLDHCVQLTRAAASVLPPEYS
ncbi:unnamed protein product [Pleuronectes platessa]|uniref:Uncharacterized protein n=1 Tax=Pleuronectes platessa TaxID=8262 RepID=A0A9N7W318_PLEPL|nr:unnamed protein product [Pleuronectes platessa]